jgi:hypothetical protein
VRVSDPYGNNPYGQNPGGQTPGGQPNPYGAPQGGGYGGGYGPPQGGFPGGSDGLPPKTDGLSIAALVVSFLCCFAPVGVILGFVGLSRTKGGKRKGRGIAIAAIIIGILMSIATGVGIAAIAIFADKVVTPANAEVGQCVNIKDEDGSIFLYKKECTESHDAEIVGVAKVDDDNLEAIETGMTTYCVEAIDPEDLAKLTPHLADIDAVIEDPNDVSVGDTLVCYVHPDDKLDKPLL